MVQLAERRCRPCSDDTPPLSPRQIQELLGQVREWNVIDNHHLEKQFRFPDFKTALDFVNQAGELAEAQDHHPDVYLAWGKVKITLWTHAVGGLSENDFILAAKIDELLRAES